MHPLFVLSSLLMVAAAGLFILAMLRHISVWSWRRDLQLLVLAAPLVSLGLGVTGLQHFFGRTCFVGAPGWDHTLGMLLPLAMALVAAGALCLGLTRHFLLSWTLVRRSLPAPWHLQGMANQLALSLGASRPAVRIQIHDRPLAVTHGLLRPTVLLSSWMLEKLDDRELQAVLAHELAHVARRDYQVVWLATSLRDAFFYLPTSWMAYRHLQRDKETACDDLAVVATDRPLSLASALGKVWHRAVTGGTLSMAQPLVGSGGIIETRIERLLSSQRPVSAGARSRLIALGIGGSGLAGLLAVEALSVATVLASMGCGPLGAFVRAV